MQVLNFGSLNIDHVYTVDHFVAPGETLCSADYRINAGGKGLNQSIALARAEAKGVLKPGMKVMVMGFGVGLSWGATIIRF